MISPPTGGSAIKTAQDYEAQAAEARRLAGLARTAAARKAILEIARMWEKLADERKREAERS